MTAQLFHTNRVKRAEPRHAFDSLAHHCAHALLHLARGFVGKGHSQNAARIGAACVDEMGDAGGERLGFTRACPCEHQNRPIEGFDRLSLRCFTDAAALHPVARYVDGIAQLRFHPQRLAFTVIAGVPPDLAPVPDGGKPPDWSVLISDDPMERDERLEERIDGAPEQIASSCEQPTIGRARPPIRLLRTAYGLEQRGARVALSSTCTPTGDAMVDTILYATRQAASSP